MEEEKLLRKIHQTERSLGVYDDTILGVPLWRLVRHFSRVRYLDSQVGLSYGSTASKGQGKAKLQFFSGFWKYVGKKNLNVFFPFNRLSNVRGEYLDKFVDPVISQTKIENGYFFILDPPNYVGDYKRVHKDHTVTNEGRTVLSQFFKYWFRLWTPIRYGKKIRNLYNKCKEEFCLDDACLKFYKDKVSSFLSSYYYYLFWFRILKPKRVFVVFREAYFSQIAVCKRLGIPVAEFQHGITIGDSKSFTGEYDSRIDPDYFLIFGEFWRGPQYGMPLDKMFCTGWAYKDFLAKKLGDKVEKKEGKILVISSPPITDSIIAALTELSKSEGNYGFDLRLHPCEKFSAVQQEKLNQIKNAQIVDNTIESAIALLSYDYVVGENSSVIYEALSVGCKVGMLNLGGLRPPVDKPGIKDNFYVINNCGDFEQFLQEGPNKSSAKVEFYSNFESQAFMNFINEKM